MKVRGNVKSPANKQFSGKTDYFAAPLSDSKSAAWKFFMVD